MFIGITRHSFIDASIGLLMAPKDPKGSKLLILPA
jgi:hypothetical protein